jgi:hypothetical protein
MTATVLCLKRGIAPSVPTRVFYRVANVLRVSFHCVHSPNFRTRYYIVRNPRLACRNTLAESVTEHYPTCGIYYVTGFYLHRNKFK